MRIDFHYHATFVAARVAGYEHDSAQTIAHASQYVDDSHLGMLRDPKGRFHIRDFLPVPTVTTNEEYVAYNTTGWSSANLLQTYRTLIPFHFLPGNYGRPNLLAYTGPKSDKGAVTRWTHTPESENHFRLVCQPNSPLVTEMIGDLVANHRDDLHAIGLRMHVLADTWAHMYFAGIPAWFINDAADKVEEIDAAGTRKLVKWTRVWPIADLFNPEFATPDMPHYNSYVYLGHGRMGHLPDYPYIRYEFQPRWSRRPIIKDNPAAFLSAFKQLVTALRCVREGRSFEVDRYAELEPAVERVVDEVLRTRTTNQCDTWLARIPTIHVDGRPLDPPEAYRPEAWLEAFRPGEPGRDESDYYRFNLAAVRHLDLVRRHLERNDLFILAGDDGANALDVSLEHESHGYLGPILEDIHASGFTQYYAAMSETPVTHKLIKIDAGPLRSGSVVQIQTTEARAGEYAYLGAWETKALYYYKQDYELSKQRWVVEKVDTSVDDVVRPGDPVRIRNIHYTRKSYLSPYAYLYWFRWRYFLTTSGKATEWRLHWSEKPLGATRRGDEAGERAPGQVHEEAVPV